MTRGVQLRLDPSLLRPTWRMPAVVRAHPVGSALAAIVGLSFAATVVYVLQLAGYFVMPDELAYVQQAIGIGAHGRPLLHSDYGFSSWSQLEPLLLAVPYGLLRATTAFDVGHVLNAAALASAAFPTYLLARRVLDWEPAAVLAAALAVGVPWMALAGTMLTENVAYPAVMWAVFAGHRAMVEPRPGNDVLAVLAIGVAAVARVQFALLLPALAAAVLLHEAGWAVGREGGWRRARAALAGTVAAVRRHPTLAVLSAGAVVVLAAVPLVTLVGRYDTTATGTLLGPHWFATTRELLGQVVLGFGLLPLALGLGWALASLVAPTSRAGHAFAALLLTTTVVESVALGSFSARFTLGVNDRYLFFLGPPLFVGALAFLLDRRRLLAPLALGAAATAALVGSASLSQRGASLVSPAAAFHGPLESFARTVTASHVGLPTAMAGLTVVAAAVVGALRLRGGRRRSAVGVGLALLAFCLAETASVMVQVAETQHAGAAYLQGREWLDRAVPGRGGAAAMLGGFAGSDDEQTSGRWWDLTFWNSDVRRVLRYESDQSFFQPATDALLVDPRTGALSGLAGMRYLVQVADDPRLEVAGARRVATRFGLALDRLPAAPRARWAMQGIDAYGRVPPGGVGRLRIYGTARAVSLTLAAAADRAHRFVVTSGPARVAAAVDPRRPVIVRVRVLPGRLVRVHVLGRPPATVDAALADPGVRIAGVAVR